MRNIPKNLDDKKDVENFLLAVREEVTTDKSHNSLSDVNGADSSSTESTKNKHVSNNDMKKIADHMDEVSKHLNQELSGSSNYISNITGAPPIVVSPASGITRVVSLTQSQIDHTQIGNIGANSHNAIDTHMAATSGIHGATATPTASSIPIADGSGKLDGWVTAATTYTGGRNIVVSGTVIDLQLESGCDVCRTTTQSINSGSSGSIIQFTTTNIDSATEYSTGGANPYSFTSANGGKYWVVASVGLTAITTNKLVEIYILLNGSIVAQNSIRAGDDGGGTADVRLQVPKLLSLSATDYIQAIVYHEHGSARNTIAEADTTYMSIAFIG